MTVTVVKYPARKKVVYQPMKYLRKTLKAGTLRNKSRRCHRMLRRSGDPTVKPFQRRTTYLQSLPLARSINARIHSLEEEVMGALKPLQR
jgi:hypothetical protein